jgi:hypothetical protein
MRFSAVLILALGVLTMNAVAQKPQRPKTKPSHSEEKESTKKGSHAVKAAPTRNSSEQELRRVEQSGARVSGARKSESGKANNNPVLKAQKKEANPPIHFASSGGSGKNKSKSGDPLKGRLRHKGSRH